MPISFCYDESLDFKKLLLSVGESLEPLEELVSPVVHQLKKKLAGYEIL